MTPEPLHTRARLFRMRAHLCCLSVLPFLVVAVDECRLARPRAADLGAQAYQLERCQSVPTRDLQGAVLCVHDIAS
jgi:hypothetical protein